MFREDEAHGTLRLWAGLREEIAEEDKPKDEWGFDEQSYYEYSPHIIEEFKNAVKYLKIAQVYAQRVDWLISGDDGEESFITRLAEDLKELNLEKETK